MSDEISLREFGRQLGVSGEAIRKAIAAGRIPPECIGVRLLSSGRSVPVIVDVTAAAAAFVETSRAVQLEIDSERVTVGNRVGNSSATVGSLHSRRVLEYYRSQLARLEYEQRSAELVPVSEVAATVAAEYAHIRAAVRAIPARVADAVVASSSAAEVRLILERAITDTLHELVADAERARMQSPSTHPEDTP